jgi:hypothetical protein
MKYQYVVIEYLQSGTLVGILPVPHPIFVRKFQYPDSLRTWFTSYMWGTVYLRFANEKGQIWAGTLLKLFVVKMTADE